MFFTVVGFIVILLFGAVITYYGIKEMYNAFKYLKDIQYVLWGLLITVIGIAYIGTVLMYVPFDLTYTG